MIGSTMEYYSKVKMITQKLKHMQVEEGKQWVNYCSYNHKYPLLQRRLRKVLEMHKD